MLARAIEKLKSEMDGNKNNPYVQVVGEFLLQHLQSHPGDGDKIQVADKTISKSLDAMRNEAIKKKTGNYAMFTPQEGFEIVMKYFGIKGNLAAVEELATGTALAQEKPTERFTINLEDLL